MSFIKYTVIVLLSIVLSVGFIAKKIKPLYRNSAIKEVSLNAAAAARSFEFLGKRIEDQVTSFSRIVSDDMDFTMKLSIDQDISAPEISEFALHFIDPMDFAFLEIVDSNYTILSSGHFPSSNGNISAGSEKIPENRAVIVQKDLKGEKYTALIVKKSFNCAGAPLFAIGGIVINDEFLNNFSTNSNTKVLIKTQEKIVGMDVKTISDIENHKIIINDKTYYASSTSLDMPENPEFITLREEPAEVTLFDLFR